MEEYSKIILFIHFHFISFHPPKWGLKLLLHNPHQAYKKTKKMFVSILFCFLNFFFNFIFFQINIVENGVLKQILNLYKYLFKRIEPLS